MDGSTDVFQKMSQLHHLHHLRKMHLCIWGITSQILKRMKLSWSLKLQLKQSFSKLAYVLYENYAGTFQYLHMLLDKHFLNAPSVSEEVRNRLDS